MQVPFNNSYAGLSDCLFTRQLPIPVTKPGLIKVNHVLARLLGIDPEWLESGEGINVIAGNLIPDGAEPIATVYAGHQFGSWNPQLGDGRAVLLGEVIGNDSERYDIQLKGSGQTPYSRSGDGRAPLGPVLREYILSEAMSALNIPTTRALAAVTTGEQVYREQVLEGAVLARVAKSHIRIGTLQFFSARGDIDSLQALVDHVIARHYPDSANADNPVLSLFEQVMANQASLIARWQSVGFIHGVMNTDNMLLSGETIDYGPCAFMDTYNPASVYSSIDHRGRYAYQNQPVIAHWNLACLAQALVPLFAEDGQSAIEIAEQALAEFPALVGDQINFRLSQKLGLTEVQEKDDELIQDFLKLLESNKLDFTQSFRRLSELPVEAEGVNTPFDFPEFAPWYERWQSRCSKEKITDKARYKNMIAVNPVVIPRNHVVESAIAKAYEGDFSLFHDLHLRLATPFEHHQNDALFTTPPQPNEIVRQTFCGT